MPYSLKKLLTIFGNEIFCLLLRSVLDRYPIIILGENGEILDEITNSIISLAPHRTQLIYYTDFVEKEEYENIIQEELNNFTIPRIIIGSHSDVSEFIFQSNFQLKGWTIAFKINDKWTKEKVISKIKEIEKYFLLIKMEENDHFNVKKYGSTLKSIDLNFEKKLVKRSIEKSKISLDKMKRVLEKKVKIPSSAEIMKSIINFDTEEEKIQSNIFNEEIQSFAHAGIRALAVLSRIDLLHELGIEIKISDKTFLSTIDFEVANSKRIIDFLKSEYNVDFSHYLQNGWKSRVGDYVDSLWG
ncbi:MAG: hypothetical protein ACTSRG_20300 [Candidatus Helarchaeota archaeon]